MNPKSLEIQDKMLKASIAGDMKTVARLRAELAYAELPEQFLLEYHRARMAFQEAERAFNVWKNRVPECHGVRADVFNMLDRNSDRLKALKI